MQTSNGMVHVKGTTARVVRPHRGQRSVRGTLDAPRALGVAQLPAGGDTSVLSQEINRVAPRSAKTSRVGRLALG